MTFNPEFASIINTSVKRDLEEREYVPYSFAHHKLFSLACERYKSPRYQEFVMAKYSPLAEWLAQPKTIDEFMQLKSNLYSLATDIATRKLFGETRIKNGFSVGETEWNERKEDWFSTLNWVFSISDALGVFPRENIAHINRAKKKSILGASVYQEIEGFDVGFVSHLSGNQRSLENLSQTLHYQRKFEYWIDGMWGQREIRRVGLIIGDFRVGDHLAHGNLFTRAKYALGARGALVVISPSKKTILETTNKRNSWDDEDRLYRLRSNRNIDFSLVVDMPSEYYQSPDTYWQQVWKAINPDLVFLGEENHPLEPVYRQQSKYLGGVLLIDNSPVIQRSGNLLEVI